MLLMLAIDPGAMVETYGPLAVFILLLLSGVGIPLSEDVIVIPAGMLVEEGKFGLLATLLAAYCGTLLADIMWFSISRRYGTMLLHRRWFKRMVHPKRMLQAKHQIEARGGWFIAAARFIPGARTSAITVAGMLHMPRWKFIAVESACIAITAPMQVGMGWLIGRGIGDQDDASLIVWLIAVAVVAALLPLLIGWIWKARRSDVEPPRARARWLRRFRKRQS